jgi:PAS domain S-box-containing protein
VNLITAMLDTSGCITFCNDYMLQLTGWQRDELLGKDWFKTILPERARDEVRTVVLSGLDSGKIVFHHDNAILTKSGEERLISWTNTILHDPQGKIAGIIGLGTDITDQKKAEEEIRELNAGLERRVQDRTAQLVTANQELEAFAYSISHDLRAPLRAMNGFSGILLSEHAGQLDDQGRAYLQHIQKASRTMDQLIMDLLNLSRVTRAALKRSRVDLSALASDIAAELTRQEPGRTLQFEITAGLEAEGDPALLKIVLENLLHNACKFTRRCERALIQMGVKQEDERRVFFVRDNGAGFDMAYAAKLFAPFQRLHGMDEFPGTGIGLVTVKRIITRHGGTIWTEAKVDEGATFYFTLD